MTEHTPGPWVWRGNATGHSLELISLAGMHPRVMTFARWGMQSALPTFRDAGLDIMRGADEYFVRPEPHNPWMITGVAHPDARLMGASPDLYDAARFALSVLSNNPIELSERTAIEKLVAALRQAEGRTP